MEKPMKLSEAMRLGSLLRPQTFGPYWDGCGTCAMGAALEAVGRLVKTTDANTRRVSKIWPWLEWRLALSRCPWCGVEKTFSSVHQLIVHLNDHDHLAREIIAGLIARVENQAIAQIENLPAELQDHELQQLRANLKGIPKKRKEPNHGHQTQETRSLSAVAR